MSNNRAHHITLPKRIVPKMEDIRATRRMQRAFGSIIKNCSGMELVLELMDLCPSLVLEISPSAPGAHYQE